MSYQQGTRDNNNWDRDGGRGGSWGGGSGGGGGDRDNNNNDWDRGDRGDNDWDRDRGGSWGGGSRPHQDWGGGPGYNNNNWNWNNWNWGGNNNWFDWDWDDRKHKHKKNRKYGNDNYRRRGRYVNPHGWAYNWWNSYISPYFGIPWPAVAPVPALPTPISYRTTPGYPYNTVTPVYSSPYYY